MVKGDSGFGQLDGVGVVVEVGTSMERRDGQYSTPLLDCPMVCNRGRCRVGNAVAWGGAGGTGPDSSSYGEWRSSKPPACWWGGGVRSVALIGGGPVIQRSLRHLGVPTGIPERCAARARAMRVEAGAIGVDDKVATYDCGS